MRANKIGKLCGVAAIVCRWATIANAESPASTTSAVAALAGQQVLELPVRVVDKSGRPIADVKVTPWALRSSQGHGLWRKGDKEAHLSPESAFTDSDGAIAVGYPAFRDSKEQIRTIGVSLAVDHPDYAYQADLHIDVPLEAKGPYEITLSDGAPLEVAVTLDGKPADLENVFALWSDGRSWQPGVKPEKLADARLRIPTMPPGDNSVLLVKLDGDRATHFSAIHDLKIVEGENNRTEIELEPALEIKGRLSANVPRPVRNGRVKVWTLTPKGAHHSRVDWFTWVPVEEDGTFLITGWPKDEPIQVIALCDGFCATSGKAPDAVENPPDPSKDHFTRPQVFVLGRQEIKLAMTPLARCAVTTVDEDEKPVAGIRVISWPNVAWWNDGSQIYCDPLVRGERLLKDRNYQDAVDKAFPQPFEAETDRFGKAMMEIPAGGEDLAMESDVYELPVFLGRREIDVELKSGKTTDVTLRLQPRGTERLGEWDKLAGVVFGCSTREGRRICALPEVTKQMDEFAKRFQEGKNQRDPQLLSEAYTVVADAFKGIGDSDEADKWRKKAAEQAVKAKEARKAAPPAKN
jgi:hypothetical protein